MKEIYKVILNGFVYFLIMSVMVLNIAMNFTFLYNLIVRRNALLSVIYWFNILLCYLIFYKLVNSIRK